MVNSSRGVSLIELLVGTAVAAVAMSGVASLLYQVGRIQSTGQIQTLIDQSYLEGVQRANNRNHFTSDSVLGVTPALKACLASVGTGCRTLGGVPLSAAQALPVPSNVDANLNTQFDLHGECTGGCAPVVSRRVSYFWDCPTDTTCSGLRLQVRSEYVPRANASADTQPPGYFRVRSGDIFIPARQLASKGQIRWNCASAGRPIARIDYVNSVAECSNYTVPTTCDMPMNGYDQPSACRTQQLQTCANGFSEGAMFTGQSACAQPVAPVSAVGP